MRILLTDHQGTLGDALVKTLAQRHEVRTLNASDDVRDRDTASRAARDCDVIIHPVCATYPDESTIDALDIAPPARHSI